MKDAIITSTKRHRGKVEIVVSFDGFHWSFDDEHEAKLAIALWDAGEKDINDFRGVLRATLRIIGRGDSPWAK
jgi:hypothetical protein